MNMTYINSMLLITLLFWQNAIADPIAKEVIRAMDEVIADHIEWDNWEEWNKLMQKVNSPFSCSIFSSILNIRNFYILYKILYDRRTNNFIT